MILQLFGLAAAIVATYFVFKTAREYERRAVLWALLTFGVGFGAQFVLPLVIGILIAVILVLTGVKPESIAETLGGWALVLTVVCLMISFVGMFLILKYVARIPDDPEIVAPPPPPTFEEE